jgi:hypothetical protein
MTMPLPPDSIMRQIAEAIPENIRGDIIIVGSFAAGYHFFGKGSDDAVMTKDVDCLLSPNVRAVENSRTVAERLLDEGWRLRQYGNFDRPGDSQTPTSELPFFRMNPPDNLEWFLELNASPPVDQSENKRVERVTTTHGDFAIFSFRFLALVEEDPIRTQYGIAIARPEMMALANLLHHPVIRQEMIQGTTDKRSNKDLGRVLALAWLANARDEHAMRAWSESWLAALKKRFPGEWKALGVRAGDGLRALLASPPDLEQATRICNDGLLVRRPVTVTNLAATGRRLLVDAIGPLETASRGTAEA